MNNKRIFAREWLLNSVAFGALNSIKDISPLSQAVLDIFLGFDLSFPSMIDGKVKPKMLTRTVQTKTKFLL